MPHELNEAWTHVYDWIQMPPANDGERDAKEWLDKFTVSAVQRDRAWLDAHPLFCTYEGAVWRVTGASRLGDVWLSADHDRQSGYEKRVDVASCSGWRMTRPAGG